MAMNQYLSNKMPIAPLKLIIMASMKDFGKRVNDYLVQFRQEINQPHQNSPAFQEYRMENFRVDFTATRHVTGEANLLLNETIRGKDLYILTDVLNRSITYNIHGYENSFSPDDHFQDLKRAIGAAAGKAHRITIIMPFLYEGRQHKRSGRESLDCALMLEELASMGVARLITFDAHDPSIQNAAPLCGFDNFTPFYQFMQALLHNVADMKIDRDHTLIISPDEGALSRAVYFASVMSVDTGMFYKRRDYTRIEKGKNPIVAHEFLGDNVEGKDVIVVDDMISSGSSMLDTAKQLKNMGAKRVFICCTFGIFTDGFAEFDEAYKKGYFEKVITTNLTYRNPEIFKKPYYIEADMAKFMASIIDCSNHDVSMTHVQTPTDRIKAILKWYNETDGTLRSDIE
ncbi:MAG: ribose-phosphate pyrophosphokinase [Lachnospiraceae bacterium]|nr:ribose-phosphate pyrophosphokinase [Lachnospiraceae bacterium]